MSSQIGSCFNHTKEAWLPVLHTPRDSRHYTALFSNSPLVHRLKKTHDEVILYCDDAQHGEHQCTIVTGRLHPLSANG